MNPLTGIPLGAYISTWSYRYDEEKENLATLTFDTGNPDTVDIADILTRFDQSFFLHGIIEAFKAEADGNHESDNEENRKKADIEAGLKF